MKYTVKCIVINLCIFIVLLTFFSACHSKENMGETQGSDNMQNQAGVSGEDKGRQKAYFAGGCFWGVEHFFHKAEGVVSTQVGYMGGDTPNPTYKQVCAGTTGHAEVMEVVFNPSSTTYENMVKLFFEIHDPTQVNRQGPDIGEQYRSAIFYIDNRQKETAVHIIKLLKQKGFDVATKLVKAEKFWKAEEYHQRYYQKKQGEPYCHAYRKIF